MTLDPGSLGRPIERLEGLVERAESVLPPAPAPADLGAAVSYRWRATVAGGRIQPVLRPHRMALADLRGIDRQKAALDRNTHRFARDRVGRKGLGEAV